MDLIQTIVPIIFLFLFTNGQVPLDHTFSFQPHGSGTAHELKADKVTLQDTQTIVIEGLYYDGKGPDAYWMVGFGDPPVERPNETPGHKIPNEKGTCDILKSYNGNTITLKLPETFTIGGSSSISVEWLSLYCISYKHNFGHVRISKNVQLPAYKKTDGPLPHDCEEMKSKNNSEKHGILMFLGSICLTIALAQQ